jgi:hypothetical protein
MLLFLWPFGMLWGSASAVKLHLSVCRAESEEALNIAAVFVDIVHRGIFSSPNERFKSAKNVTWQNVMQRTAKSNLASLTNRFDKSPTLSPSKERRCPNNTPTFSA